VCKHKHKIHTSDLLPRIIWRVQTAVQKACLGLIVSSRMQQIYTATQVATLEHILQHTLEHTLQHTYCHASFGGCRRCAPDQQSAHELHPVRALQVAADQQLQQHLQFGIGCSYTRRNLVKQFVSTKYQTMCCSVYGSVCCIAFCSPCCNVCCSGWCSWKYMQLNHESNTRAAKQCA